MVLAPQLVAFWGREAGWTRPRAWSFVWSLLWASLTGPGRPRPPPSGALFFPHLCSSHPLNSCLSLPLDHHLIFLFPQPLAQGSGQCVLRKICQRSEDTCPPTCGKEAGVCPAQQPRCEAVSSVRPCCETIQSVVPWGRGGWRRGARRVPSPRCLVAKLCPALLQPRGLSPPGPSVHGVIQARILEWVAMSFSSFPTHPAVIVQSLSCARL